MTNTISDHSPQYGLEEVAAATLTTIENPAVVLAASRAPQTDSADDKGKDNTSDDPTDSDLKSAIRGPEVNVDDLDQTRANAELGDAAAQVRLGDAYLEGRFEPQDYLLAMEWFLKAAEQGDPDGERKVGLIHYLGHGVPQDYKKAMDKGDQGVSRDLKHAAEWYHKAAEQGNPHAQWALGKLYHHGSGVSLDYTKAMEWYLRASRQGNGQARADIGFLHYYGQGVPQDFAAAVKWCLQAAEQDNSDAQYRLGHMHEYGQGVPQDYSKAMEWYRKAADQGDWKSSKMVGHLYHKGLAVPRISTWLLRGTTKPRRRVTMKLV
ncbi:hypothetical protein BGZ95_002011 [Linnemannia exigua]|uniref:HCP-like protein n=1 Tax=Linnemannia exigua TaxID=604196 RepID=A0AAD4H3A0_9FUNG|nr:hypothetical protein BGZ95_002011 [Linnemannia exigua]